MTINRIVRIIAGFFVLASMALGVKQLAGFENPLFMHEYWLFLTAFVGLNLFQSGFTTFCPLDIILKKAGVSDGCQGTGNGASA